MSSNLAYTIFRDDKPVGVEELTLGELERCQEFFADILATAIEAKNKKKREAFECRLYMEELAQADNFATIRYTS